MVDPVVSFVGAFDPSVIPFSGPDFPDDAGSEINSPVPSSVCARYFQQVSGIGAKIDFGSGYFGVATGTNPSDITGSSLLTLPGFIQLWRITDTGARFINQFRIDIPTALAGGGQGQVWRPTQIETHAKLSSTKAVCIGYTGGGNYSYGYIVERLGETISFGPIFLLSPEEEKNSVLDPDFPVLTDPPLTGWLAGSMLVLAAETTNSFVVAAGFGFYDDAHSFGVATRRYTVSGSTATPAGEWRSNPDTRSFFAPNQYAWLFGLAVVGAWGYVFAYDYMATWSLHRIDLATGGIVQSVQVTRTVGAGNSHAGVMAPTAGGITTIIYAERYLVSEPEKLEVRTYDPATLNLLGEYEVVDQLGTLNGMWQEWLSNELPVAGIAGYVPWVFTTFYVGHNAGEPGYPVISRVGLFDATHAVFTEFTTPFHGTQGLGSLWDAGIAVIGDGQYLVASHPRLSQVGWGANPTPGDHDIPCGLFRIQGQIPLTGRFRSKNISFGRG